MVLGREVTGYAVASALAFACDFAVLAALVQLLQWHYLAAATAAFMVGATVAYVLSICFVFRYRRVANRRVEFLIFLSIGAAGLATNTASMWVGVDWLGFHYLLAKVLAGGLTFALNYGARRLLLFTDFGTASLRKSR